MLARFITEIDAMKEKCQESAAIKQRVSELRRIIVDKQFSVKKVDCPKSGVKRASDGDLTDQAKQDIGVGDIDAAKKVKVTSSQPIAAAQIKSIQNRFVGMPLMMKPTAIKAIAPPPMPSTLPNIASQIALKNVPRIVPLAPAMGIPLSQRNVIGNRIAPNIPAMTAQYIPGRIVDRRNAVSMVPTGQRQINNANTMVGAQAQGRIMPTFPNIGDMSLAQQRMAMMNHHHHQQPRNIDSMYYGLSQTAPRYTGTMNGAQTNRFLVPPGGMIPAQNLATAHTMPNYALKSVNNGLSQRTVSVPSKHTAPQTVVQPIIKKEPTVKTGPALKTIEATVTTKPSPSEPAVGGGQVVRLAGLFGLVRLMDGIYTKNGKSAEQKLEKLMNNKHLLNMAVACLHAMKGFFNGAKKLAAKSKAKSTDADEGLKMIARRMKLLNEMAIVCRANDKPFMACVKYLNNDEEPTERSIKLFDYLMPSIVAKIRGYHVPFDYYLGEVGQTLSLIDDVLATNKDMTEQLNEYRNNILSETEQFCEMYATAKNMDKVIEKIKLITMDMLNQRIEMSHIKVQEHGLDMGQCAKYKRMIVDDAKMMDELTTRMKGFKSHL